MTFLMKLVITSENEEIKRNFLEKFGRIKEPSSDTGANYGLIQRIIDNRDLKFQIWNLKHYQRFNAVRSVYYLGSLGGIVVFDVSNSGSFENCPYWVNETWTNNGKGTIPVALYGNITNEGHREVSRSAAERYAKTLSEQTKQAGFSINYYEGSFAEGDQIEDVLKYLGKAYFAYLEKQRRR